MPKPGETTVEDREEVAGEEASETKTPAAEPEDPAVKALRILEGIQEKMGGGAPKAPDLPAQPSYAQVRDKIKEETGWTDAQVDFHIRSLSEASAVGRKQEAFSELSDKFADFKDFKKAVSDELKAYPAAQHGDPVLLEKIYWMEKGKRMSTTSPKTPPAANPGQRRPAPSYNGFESGTDAGGRGQAKGSLSGEEKELARRMGISEDKWEKSKGTRVIKDLRE